LLFDKLLLDEKLTHEECIAALFQIVMILVLYQKTFHFTHNDLHTNNIVYSMTDKKYLYYTFDAIHYRVPTYGYIFKLIDFGRSIYTVNGITLCSDSFDKKGDAETQYNFEPFYNPTKPKIEPNYSFDLCRLACSMYDFIFTPHEYAKHKSSNITELKTIILDWCMNDKGKNILYKKNGEERYNNFKLYKMIARTVHNSVPKEQLEKQVFKQFQIKTPLKKRELEQIMNLDEIPCYV